MGKIWTKKTVSEASYRENRIFVTFWPKKRRFFMSTILRHIVKYSYFSLEINDFRKQCSSLTETHVLNLFRINSEIFRN